MKTTPETLTAPRFDLLLDMALTALVETFKKTWETSSGTPYHKTDKRIAEEYKEYQVFLKILGHVFQWQGMDHAGNLMRGTISAVENRLRYIAAERGLLKKGDGVYPTFTLPYTENLNVRVK